MEVLFGKLQVIHDKYKRGYDELSQDGRMEFRNALRQCWEARCFRAEAKNLRMRMAMTFANWIGIGKTYIGIKKEATAKVIADELFEVHKTRKTPKRRCTIGLS